MAQLKEDEWPQDGEPTTSEEEGGKVKGEDELGRSPKQIRDRSDGLHQQADDRGAPTVPGKRPSSRS